MSKEGKCMTWLAEQPAGAVLCRALIAHTYCHQMLLRALVIKIEEYCQNNNLDAAMASEITSAVIDSMPERLEAAYGAADGEKFIIDAIQDMPKVVLSISSDVAEAQE